MGTIKLNNAIKKGTNINKDRKFINMNKTISADASVGYEEGQEIIKLRSVNSKTMRVDNKIRKLLYAVPQYYNDKNTGELIPIVTDVIDNGTKYVCEKNNFKIEFEKNSNDGKVYELSKDNYSVSLYYRGENQRCLGHMEGCICGQCIEKNKVSYITQEGTEIIYESLNNGIKENIIVNERQDNYEYNFVMNIKGLKVEEGDDNSILLKDERTGKAIFRIPAPYMYDGNGVRSNNVSYEVDILNAELNFKVIASSEFINAEDRVFPIVIDPQIFELVEGTWNFSCEGKGYDGSIIRGDGGLNVGPSDNVVYHSRISFYNISILNDPNVIKKSVRLHTIVGQDATGYFIAAGQRYKGGQAVYEIEFTDTWVDLESDTTNPLTEMMEFGTKGENAPVLIIEYPIDQEIGDSRIKEVPFKNISLGDSVTGYLNLKTANVISAVNDITVGKTLPIQIMHVHRADGNDKGCFICIGKVTEYIYVNELGNSVSLVEKYYYIKDDYKIVVDKKDVITDINGNLSYDGYEVRKYQANDDIMLISEIKDFINSDIIDSRQSEQVQLEEYINTYIQRLQNLVIVNKLSNTLDSSIEELGILAFEERWKSLNSNYILMTKAEFEKIGKLKGEELENLTKQIYKSVAIYETYFVGYRQKIAELENYVAQSPVNYLKENNGTISGFNSEGKLVCIFDRNQNSLFIVYNTDGNISELYEGDEIIASFSYKNGLLQCITDSRGRTVTFNYEKNSSGDKDLLSSITYADNSTIKFGYSSNCLTPIEYSNGLIYKPTYKSGAIKSLSVKGTYPNTGTISETDFMLNDSTITINNNTTGEYEEFTLDSNNNIINHISTDAYKTSTITAYKYENAGSKVTVTKKLNNSQQEETAIEEYDDMNLLRSRSELKYQISDNLYIENKTKYSYDLNDQLISEITSSIYTDKGEKQVKTVVNVKKYHYNAQGVLVLTESYIENEELTSGIDYEEHIFDSKGRELTTISWNSLDSSSKFYSENKYSENGEQVAECNELGEVSSQYEYVNGSNLINSVIYANGSKFAYGRDPKNDIVTSITQSTESGEANTTNIVYERGLPTKISSENTEVNYVYDYARRKTSINVNGQQQYSAKYNLKYSFDNDNNEVNYGTMTETLYAGEEKFEFITSKYGKIDDDTGVVKLTETVTVNKNLISEKKYDNYRRLTEVTDGTHKVTYEYDNYDRLISAKVNDNNVTQAVQSYSYDTYGNLIKKTITGAVTQTYTYAYKDNAARSLESISISGYKFKPLTDVNGRNIGREIFSGANKIAAEYITYRKVGDHATNMPAAVWFGSGKNIKDSIKYKYDSCGNICEISENGHKNSMYHFDSLNRLIREDNKNLGKTILFSYDSNGNITERCEYEYTRKSGEELSELECKHYSYDYDGDRLVSYNGEEFSYNNLGNPTKYRGKSTIWLYGKLLTSYKGVSFTYDGKGSRVSKGSITFTYDSDGRLIKQSNGLEFIYDNSGVSGVKYSGAQYFYRKDAQGNIIAILDSTGKAVVKYVYDAWGNHAVVDANGNDVTSGIGVLNPFRYRGYYYDTETELYYLQTRYYDPELGRFISQDSLEYADPETVNGLNLYAYCGNNPVMNVDPNGNAWWKWLIAAVATVGLIVGSIILTVTTGGLVAAVITGAAIGASASLATQSAAGAINLGSFFLDTAVGAISGAFSYGAGKIGADIGGKIGSAIGEMTINGLQVSKVFTNGILSAIGSVVGGVVGGISSGIFFDKYANMLLDRDDSLLKRIRDNLQGSVFSSILDFLRFLWKM